MTWLSFHLKHEALKEINYLCENPRCVAGRVFETPAVKQRLILHLMQEIFVIPLHPGIFLFSQIQENDQFGLFSPEHLELV